MEDAPADGKSSCFDSQSFAGTQKCEPVCCQLVEAGESESKKSLHKALDDMTHEFNRGFQH